MAAAFKHNFIVAPNYAACLSALRSLVSPRGYEVFSIPQPICDASVHSRGHAKRVVDLDEVIRDPGAMAAM